jgi:predicted nucleic acid-binding Zn finger protein
MVLKIRDKVRVPVKLNSVWAGEGEVVHLYEDRTAIVHLTSGRMAGKRGGFDASQLVGADDLPVVPATTMQIVKIKRSTQKTGLKVYGEVLSTSGNTYNFAYIRRSNFRGWICSCENFFFTMFKKNRNCKHIKFVRAQAGRYATKLNILVP